MLLLQAVHGFGEEALHRTGPQEELARARARAREREREREREGGSC